MSKGNIIQGQASGKLGDTVLMVRNGQQLARVYTKAGARSGSDASEAARIQRVKFGAASNQWNLYKYVCTRMYRKGRKTTQSDYNYFVKRNQHLLPYLTKQENADGVHVLMPGQFSEGNLGRIELVHSITASPSEAQDIMSVSDLNSEGGTTILFSARMSVLKASLAARFPAASKITYLISIPSEVSISEDDLTFVSQFVNHNTVIIDLYNESQPGENDLTVSAFFADRIKDSRLSAVFAAQTLYNFTSSIKLFRLYNYEGADLDYIKSIAVLVFATNDGASDCYTTILQDTSVPVQNGPYSLWAGYRTQSSLRVAADSYGYQSGVMRDDIASVGDDLTEQITQYIAKLRVIDSDTASLVEAEMKSGTVRTRTVRKVVAPSESEE